MWLLFAFGSSLFAGLTAILAKIGVRNVNSNVATAVRTTVVLVFSWIMVFVVGSQSTLSAVPVWTLVFLFLSGLATGASWLCYFRALHLGDVNKVTPIDKSSTVLTMLLAFLLLGEPLTPLKAAAMAVIAWGTWLMIPRRTGESAPEQGRHGWLFFALLSALFASLTAILGKIGIQDIESNLGTALRTIVVLIMAWFIVFLRKEQGQVRDISRRNWLFLVLSGVATGLSWLCYYRALQDGPASVVVPIDKLSILVTILFSRLILGERIGRRALAGLALIVVGTLSLLV